MTRWAVGLRGRLLNRTELRRAPSAVPLTQLRVGVDDPIGEVAAAAHEVLGECVGSLCFPQQLVELPPYVEAASLGRAERFGLLLKDRGPRGISGRMRDARSSTAYSPAVCLLLSGAIHPRAALYTRDHAPFSELYEVYQRQILAFPPPPLRESSR